MPATSGVTLSAGTMTTALESRIFEAYAFCQYRSCLAKTPAPLMTMYDACIFLHTSKQLSRTSRSMYPPRPGLEEVSHFRFVSSLGCTYLPHQAKTRYPETLAPNRNVLANKKQQPQTRFTKWAERATIMERE